MSFLRVFDSVSNKENNILGVVKCLLSVLKEASKGIEENSFSKIPPN